MVLLKSAQPEKVDGDLGPPFRGEVRERLPECRTEFETMSTEPASQDDSIILRMPVDDEVPIRRHRVHAGLHRVQWAH